MSNGQSYPTTLNMMTWDLVSEGFFERDIVQIAEFLKGEPLTKGSRVTQTLRNKVKDMLVNNAAPRVQ